jgi:hypothetical protein
MDLFRFVCGSFSQHQRSYSYGIAGSRQERRLTSHVVKGTARSVTENIQYDIFRRAHADFSPRSAARGYAHIIIPGPTYILLDHDLYSEVLENLLGSYKRDPVDSFCC